MIFFSLLVLPKFNFFSNQITSIPKKGPRKGKFGFIEKNIRLIYKYGRVFSTELLLHFCIVDPTRNSPFRAQNATFKSLTKRRKCHMELAILHVQKTFQVQGKSGSGSIFRFWPPHGEINESKPFYVDVSRNY